MQIFNIGAWCIMLGYVTCFECWLERWKIWICGCWLVDRYKRSYIETTNLGRVVPRTIGWRSVILLIFSIVLIKIVYESLEIVKMKSAEQIWLGKRTSVLVAAFVCSTFFHVCSTLCDFVYGRRTGASCRRVFEVKINDGRRVD